MRAARPSLVPAILFILCSWPSALTGQVSWRTFVEKDPLTDARKRLFRLTGSHVVSGALGRPVRPDLIVRCVNGDVDAVFIGVEAVVADTDVGIRWDQNPAYPATWVEAQTNTALFAPDAVDVLDSLLTHRTLIVRYMPFQSTAQDARFVLTGLAAHATILKVDCGVDVAQVTRQVAAARAQDAARRRALAADSARAEEVRSHRVAVIELAATATAGFNLAPGEPLPLRVLALRFLDSRGRPTQAVRLIAHVVDSAGAHTWTDTDTLRLDQPGDYLVRLQVDDAASATIPVTVRGP
jgi:hypothetical protein